MTKEQVSALISQKVARAKHAAAQDALLQYESVWAGVNHHRRLRLKLRREVQKAALDMINTGAATPWR